MCVRVGIRARRFVVMAAIDPGSPAVAGRGASNEPDEDFCGECAAALGQPLAPSSKKSATPPIRVAEAPDLEKLEGERKTVTTLFADIKCSMELIEDLDPEQARAIVDPALKLMMDAVQRYGGYVIDLVYHYRLDRGHADRGRAAQSVILSRRARFPSSVSARLAVVGA